MRMQLIPFLLVLALCLSSACAHALVVQSGDVVVILDDSVSEAAGSSETSIITSDGTPLKNGDILLPVQIPNALWLQDQLESVDQTQLLQDMTTATYLMNCLQTRETSSSESISVDSLEGFLDFFFDGSARLVFEDDKLCRLELSNESYMEFQLEDACITGASLYLSGIENAYGQSLCVDYALP